MKRFYTILASAALMVSAYAAPLGSPVAAGAENLRVNATTMLKLGDTPEQFKASNSSRMLAAPMREVANEGNLVVTKVNGVITDVTGVDSKFYERANTGTTYFIQNNGLVYSYQSGTVEIKEDGDNVYIKDPLTRFTQGSWVKGTKDGNTLSIATWQPLSYNSTYNASICLAWGDANNGYKVSDHSDVITFTIDGNTLTLEGTTSLLVGKGYLIGAYWNDDLSYQGYWDAETVLTYDDGYVPPSTDLVELPAGASPEGWYLNAADANGNSIENQEVNVAFVGDDVYVQGISSYFPDSWAKGTLSGTTITFDKFQYLGNYAGSYDIWILGCNADDEMCDLTAMYDAAARTITFNESVIINAAADRIYYLEWLDDVVLSAEAVVYEEPVLTEQVASLPYENTFDTAEEQAQVVCYDANKDGKTFMFVNDNGNQALRIAWNSSADADDYVAFPGLSLKAGQNYTVSLSARCQGYKERFEVVCGPVAKVSEYTITVIEPTDVTNKTYETFGTTEFMVEEDGLYFFAVHGISDADQFYLYIDDFAVYETPEMSVVLWDNSLKNYDNPCVNYSVDGGETYEGPISMTPLEQPSLTGEGYNVVAESNQIYAAYIPAETTHVFFSNGDSEEDRTKAYDFEEDALYDGNVDTGIDTISAPEAKAEYFNLQGIRVETPAAGNIYIVRRGNAVTKEIK